MKLPDLRNLNNIMKTILKTEFGSIVYGTNLPTSDTDFKSVIIPSDRDILLQSVPKTIQQNTKISSSEKNTKDDVDHEIFSISYFLKLLAEGQTPCIDLLFTPKKHWVEYNPLWEEIVNNKEKLLSSQVSSFVGYTRTQAAKYGIKGTRVAALRLVLDWLKDFEDSKRIYDAWPPVFVKKCNNEYINIVEINGPNGKIEPHLEVCNRKIPYHASIKYAKAVFQKIFDEYGHRALAAEQNLGVDYKALYHAVRVGKEAHELLTTGNITFPRPEKELLLQIRKGELHYKEVADIIEQGLYNVEEAQKTSILQATPDYNWIEEFILNVHRKEIIGS